MVSGLSLCFVMWDIRIQIINGVSCHRVYQIFSCNVVLKKEKANLSRTIKQDHTTVAAISISINL